MVNAQLGTVLGHLHGLAAAGGTEGLSDTELLRRFCASREEVAFAALMQRYGRLVWRICRDVLRHEQDAEDAFQATFLALARQAGSIRTGEAIASWLHGTARHIALTARRAAVTRRLHERRRRSMPPEKPLSEEALREALGMLDDEVQCLPERQRAAFVLCCLEGKSQAEAARLLGWKEGTVSSALTRARRHLRRRLAQRGVTLSSALCAVVLTRQGKAAPALLMRSTVRAALADAAGNTAVCTVSAAVAALAQGATSTMKTKLKTLIVLVLALGLGVAAIGALAFQEVAARPPQAPAAAAGPEQAKGLTDQAPAKPATPKGEAVEVSGLVVGPDAKPFAGARLFVVTGGARKADLKVQATTGADGRFRMRVSPAELERDARLLATAAGHGPDWVLCQPGRGWPDQVRLRLFKEVPITGRLLNDEGQPLAGIDLQVLSVEKGTDGRDPTPQIYGPQLTNAMVISKPETIGISAAALGLPGSVKTGKDGSFRLSGVGRGRLVRLALRAPNREHADLCVTTAFAGVGSVGAPWGIYGHTFKHLVLPSRPIVGSVRDKRNGKPLAGIAVIAQASMPALETRFHGDVIGIPARTSTDDKGRFRLDGIGKHDFYHLHAGGSPPSYYFPHLPAGGSPYMGQDKLNIKDTPGLEPLTVDFELDRGVLLRGRLTDKVTGKPVQGWVSSVPLADNPNRKLFAVVGGAQVQTAADGSFSFVAVPGPGLLLVKASRLTSWGPGMLNTDEEDRYAWMHVHDDSLVRDLAAVLGDPIAGGYWHAVVRIDPSAKDTEVTVGAIALEPGQTRTGTVVGPDGKPLKGVLPFGLFALERFAVRGPLTTASFTAKGLSKRTPRPLLFIHPGTRLSKLEWVKADGEKPLTVRLEPPGTLTGRLVDPTGRPLAGISIWPWTRDVVLNKHFPLTAVGSEVLSPPGFRKTDADGKFRLEGLLPAVKYDLWTSGRRAVQLTTGGVSVESGKVKHLGDLMTKGAPNGQKEKEQ
jgi:RNA polymerase sigma factor (sigma-70 family)